MAEQEFTSTSSLSVEMLSVDHAQFSPPKRRNRLRLPVIPMAQQFFDPLNRFPAEISSRFEPLSRLCSTAEESMLRLGATRGTRAEHTLFCG
jgi:hypothetical protein